MAQSCRSWMSARRPLLEANRTMFARCEPLHSWHTPPKPVAASVVYGWSEQRFSFLKKFFVVS